VAANDYMLEHFYRGQTVSAGAPDSDMRLLAGSKGIVPEMVAEAVQLAIIPPLSKQPMGALALVRSAKHGFYFTQSQMGAAGQFMTHVVIIPSEVVRGMSGNLRGLLALAEEAMPSFESTGVMLQPLSYTPVDPPGGPQATRAMLALMSATRNRINTIETLLAAVITNIPVRIFGAPPEVDKRLALVEGLLALMPSPARLGVTFATHAAPQRRPQTIITFLPDSESPPDGVSYRWGEANPVGVEVQDEYAHFIAGQLRLDTELVLQGTEALTPVAGWRIRLGDSLSAALHYAAQRLKTDNAVLGNQPVELDAAAQVLTDDPTLSDEVRLAYTSHLLKLALPLQATDHLRQIGRVARGSSALEAALLHHLEETLNAGAHAETIFHTLVDWISDSGGFSGMLWVEQAQRAARMHTQALVAAGDAEGLATFLRAVGSAPSSAQVAPVLPTLVDLVLPLAGKNAALTQTVIALAAAAYPTDRFQKLFDRSDLLAHLPQNLVKLMPYLFGSARGETSGLLAKAASAFEEEIHPLMAIRLAEIAMLRDRGDLLDVSALQLLAKAAASAWGDTYDQTLRWIVRNLSTDQRVYVLGDDGARSLVRILLARRAYNDFASSLLNAGRVIFGQDRSANAYADFVQSIFTDAELTPGAALNALKALEANAMKPLPLMMAHYGALQAAGWSAAMAGSAADLQALVVSNPLIATQAPLPLILSLVQYHMSRVDTPSAVRVAEMTPGMAAAEGEGGTLSMLRLYGLMNDDEATRAIATQLMRRFVRLLPAGEDRRAATRIMDKLGAQVKSELDVTLLYKRIFDGVPIEEYAGYLHSTASLLRDTALTYADRERVPGLKILLGDLDALFGGFTAEDRATLAREIIDLGKVIVALAQRQKALRPRPSNAQLEALITGIEPSIAPLDVFRSMGGYFSRGKRANISLSPTNNPHPLGTRGAHDLLHDVQVSLRLLRGFLRAFPAEGRWKFTSEMLWSELESLWDELPLEDRRKLVHDLAFDLQRLPEYVMLIAEQGNPRALVEDDRNMRKLELGERKPDNALELYRLVSGYFRLRGR
jgi:hypothetical protein